MIRETSNLELVIGGTGFLGVHLVESLVAQGCRVLVVARRSPLDARVVLPEGVGFHPVEDWSGSSDDMPRQMIMLSAISNGQFKRVWHLAALSRAADAERDPTAALAINCNWPAAIAGAAQGSATPMLHVSTDLVFGANQPPETGFAPSDSVAPLGVYGHSKAQGEVAVREQCAHADIVRLPLLFGDSRRRQLGATDSMLALLHRGVTPQLFADEWRTPLDVRAAALGLVTLAKVLDAEPQRRGQTWHLGGRRVSRADLGRALALQQGWEPDSISATTRAAFGLEATRAADASLDSRATLALSETLQNILESGSAPSFP